MLDLGGPQRPAAGELGPNPVDDLAVRLEPAIRPRRRTRAARIHRGSGTDPSPRGDERRHVRPVLDVRRPRGRTAGGRASASVVRRRGGRTAACSATARTRSPSRSAACASRAMATLSWRVPRRLGRGRPNPCAASAMRRASAALRDGLHRDQPSRGADTPRRASCRRHASA